MEITAEWDTLNDENQEKKIVVTAERVCEIFKVNKCYMNYARDHHEITQNSVVIRFICSNVLGMSKVIVLIIAFISCFHFIGLLLEILLA